VSTGFRLFGLAHLAILVAIPAIAAVLARWANRARFAIGAVLVLNEAIWWIWLVRHEGVRFPTTLPLQLCDLTLWLTILTLFRLTPWAYEVAYYGGIAGTGMAVLTPDLWAPFPSYPTAYFFLYHGGVIIGVLTLTWGKLLRPRPGSVRRVVLILNGYALAVGAFNAVFGTNYMYLCQKPAEASLLNYLGPWPFYILPAELLAVLLFWLLWLPFRNQRAPSA
jgi:hypothetical integral membrane protein (TIGR02206 family)